jgi:hypothetical protein
MKSRELRRRVRARTRRSLFMLDSSKIIYIQYRSR